MFKYTRDLINNISQRRITALLFAALAVLAAASVGVASQTTATQTVDRPSAADGIPTDQLNRSSDVVSESASHSKTYIIVATSADVVDIAVLGQYGTVGTQLQNRVEMTMTPSNRSAVAQLRWVSDIRPAQSPQPSQVAGSGNASSLGVENIHADGTTGDGVRVGVIDTGFRTDEPAISDNIANLRQFNEQSSPTHGVQAAETVVRTAPDSNLYLASVSNNLDVEAAIDYLQRQDVDIIVMSLSFLGLNDDGNHDIAEQVSRARDSGTLVVFSAGNQRQLHWQGEFNDPDTDAFLDWVDGDERQCVPGCDRKFRGGTLTVYIDYPRDGDGSDYRADLINPVSRTVIASSQRAFVTDTRVVERITVRIPAQTVDLQIENTAGPADDTIELNVDGAFSIEQPVEASSITAPAGSPDSVGVAAYARQQGRTARYSSVGPTDDGRQAPTVTGYTNIDTSNGVFTGTSAAAPYVAGVAALVEDKAPGDQSPAELESALVQTADDIEQPGTDSRSGTGVVNAEAAVASVSTPSGTVITRGDRVFQGQDNIVFQGDSGTTYDTLTGVSGDAEGQVLATPIPQDQTVGRYSDNGRSASQGNDIQITVNQPRISDFEVRNATGQDVTGGSVTQSNAANLTVAVEYNFGRYEGIDLTVENPSRLEIQQQVITGNSAEGADGDSVANTSTAGTSSLTFDMDLSAQPTGRYTVSAEGTDTLDFGQASQRATVELTNATPAGPRIDASVTDPGQPGGQAQVQYTLSDTTGQGSVALALTAVPPQLTINESASATSGTFRSDGQTILFLQPGDTVQSTVAFDIAPTASDNATFTIDADVLDETSTATDSVSIDVGNVQQDLIDRFDTNGDGQLSLRELQTAIRAFAAGDLTIRDIQQLIRVFSGA